MVTKTESELKLEMVWRKVVKSDAELVKRWKRWSKNVANEEAEHEFLDWFSEYEWSITRFGHTFTATPSGYISIIINSLQPILFIKVYEDGAQFEISAELSEFTRVHNKG